MTAPTAPPPATGGEAPGASGTPVPLVVAGDGSYAARLTMVRGATSGDGGWCPERWTLDGPEPYAVRLPGNQPEEPDSPVAPLPDGRVLIGRRAAGRYHFSLLYPSGPDTGELVLGSVECDRLTLVPPAPTGHRVYALVPNEDGQRPATELWLVCGGRYGPELVTRLDGRCAGGAWLDRAGRLLALNRTDANGRTRAVTVTVDAELGGPPTELLRIAEDSNDRLLLADPGSGLLLVASDAPGEERVGWGVLGSHRPVRFPEALHVPGVRVTPFAVQPGQVLQPEACDVALRMTTAEADWVAVWRPQQRELQHLSAPEGWLAGTGLWTADGELLLPYVSPQVPCGLHRIAVPVPEPSPVSAGAGSEPPAAAATPGEPAAPPPASDVPQPQAPTAPGAAVDGAPEPSRGEHPPAAAPSQAGPPRSDASHAEAPDGEPPRPETPRPETQRPETQRPENPQAQPSHPGSSAPGAPAPGAPAPGSPAPGAPAPGSPAPGAPAPGSSATQAPQPEERAESHPAPATKPASPPPPPPPGAAAEPDDSGVPRPVPLQQAPLGRPEASP